MQRQVLKMLEGSAADVEPSFADKMYLPSGAKVSGSDWKRLIDAGNVFLWLDYSSVPASVAAAARSYRAIYRAPARTVTCDLTTRFFGNAANWIL